MAEIGIVEYFAIGEAIGIIGAFFVGFYYSRKQMKDLSLDIESKILHDLNEQSYKLAEMAMEKPEVAEVLDKDESKRGPKVAFAMTALYTFAHAFHMHQRKVLRDNEWYRWLRSMRVGFKNGTIGEYWKTIGPEDWFDPEFRDFIENEIIGQQKE